MLEPGAPIDVWEVVAPLGAGGMGTVFRCRNARAPRIEAAIKILDPAVRRVAGAEARFIREAEILHTLDHPNVVRVFNVHLTGDLPYIEMAYVRGQTLKDRLAEGPLPLSEALRLIAQLLDAVAYLHARGIRHRDIKPANVVVDDAGRLVLVDFGLAQDVGAVTITRANTTFGTATYAPPEWIRPEQIDAAAWDVYACGVVLHEMITGTSPFLALEGSDPCAHALQVMIIKQTHPALDPGPAWPEAVRALVRDMTEPDRARRLCDARVALTRTRAILGVPDTDTFRTPPSLPAVPGVAVASYTPTMRGHREAVPPTFPPDAVSLSLSSPWIDRLASPDSVRSLLGGLAGASLGLVTVIVFGFVVWFAFVALPAAVAAPFTGW